MKLSNIAPLSLWHIRMHNFLQIRDGSLLQNYEYILNVWSYCIYLIFMLWYILTVDNYWGFIQCVVNVHHTRSIHTGWKTLTLQWRHMSLIASQINRKRIFPDQFVHGNNRQDFKCPHDWPLWGEASVTDGFPWKIANNAGKVSFSFTFSK